MKITLQIACDDENVPSKKLFSLWLNTAEKYILDPRFRGDDEALSVIPATPSVIPAKAGIHPKITLRIVDKTESQELNRSFRGKDKPTNVLSFPPNEIPGFKNDSLGDLALCAAIIAEEAAEQDKELKAHWAHMTIHGFLHLLGYDHIENGEAEAMEALEVKILQELNYPNPY